MCVQVSVCTCMCGVHVCLLAFVCVCANACTGVSVNENASVSVCMNVCMCVHLLVLRGGWTCPPPQSLKKEIYQKCGVQQLLIWSKKHPSALTPFSPTPPTPTPPTLPTPHPILKCKGIGLTHFTLGSTIRGKRQEGKTRNEKKIVIHSLYFLSVHFPTITHSSLTRNIKFINA